MKLATMGERVPSVHTMNFEMLPVFAQALVACRLARRAVLTLLSGDDLRLAISVCDAMESISKHGDGWRADDPTVSSLAAVSRTRENAAALEALCWALDSIRAAQRARDFPLDETVTKSAQRCIKSVCDDSRISVLQVMILVENDIDQIAFACREVDIRKNDGLSVHVLGRLVPCHPLTLVEPPHNIEETYR